MDDKDTPAHLEHGDHGTESISDEISSSNLNITHNSWLDNKKGIAICLVINMAFFEYGLDLGMVNGFQAMPGFLRDFGYQDSHLPGGYGISTTVQQLMSSLVSAGMFVSTFLAGRVTDAIGRKKGLWIANFLMALSVTIQISVVSLGGLYSGRLLLGFSNGFYTVCAQLYMQETTPSNLRSLSYTFYQFWIGFGSLIGTLVNNSTQVRLDRSSYRVPLGVLYIIPMLLSVALLFLPETPRYLAAKGRYEDSHFALRRLRDAAFTDLQVKEEAAEIRNAIETDKELSAGVGYGEMFRPPHLKRTLTSLGLGLYSAANGVPFVIQFGIYFFTLSGDSHPFRSGVILSCVGLAGAMITPLFTGRVGKRPLLMLGGLVQSLCMLGFALPYTIRGIDPTSGRVIIAMACIYLFTASATTSPFSWQVAGEIPSQRLRGHTFGFASSVTFLMGWCITFTIPYFINPTALNWGAQYGYIWFGTNLLIIVFTFFVVPETNKRTLEEIDECYNQKVPIRKFPNFECQAALDSRMKVVRDTKLERE
ncbi:general substrate transporter [Lophiotrema nucula]|uniref:General substrate transporter n=1 Tax=Lophiotrema nucula TaxID=690887 RepID=A0A6A5ZG61_9PLEO|nr:general substrate transporter [Lophiotrema nucula]